MGKLPDTRQSLLTILALNIAYLTEEQLQNIDMDYFR